jgi:hypothetical protein
MGNPCRRGADAASGKEVDFNAIEDLHNVSGLIKLFLRELPEPLLSTEYYSELLAICGIYIYISLYLALDSRSLCMHSAGRM